MNSCPVILVAFKESDNLGVGYLASVLSEGGFDSLILDFRDGGERILQTIQNVRPEVVGFSVIFQYHIYEFRHLIKYLRKSGITSHFCAGGQYASMRYEELFRMIPSLDTIVRFEGEYTFLELVRCICSGTGWQKIDGLAYRANGRIIANPLRPPEMDLDNFPFPKRSAPGNYVLRKKFATILAGRGCVNNCSFCNNTEYIRQSSMPVRRLRQPEKVVEEINYLYQTSGCSIFLFEDDDFPVRTRNGSEWIEKFCAELKRKKLVNKIIWKINCRPDEIDLHSFRMMKDHGLFLVFLGLDDGTDEGLIRLNKRITAAESMTGINILKELKTDFDYGFMLFQPESTFKSVNDNIRFLELLCLDGSAPVTFVKLEPFFDTRTEKELRVAGRLKGKPGFYDYDFRTNSLNHYYKFLSRSFAGWINDPEGLLNIGKWAINYIAVFSHFYKMTPEAQTLSFRIRKSIAQGNRFILDTMKELAFIFESGNYEPWKYSSLNQFRRNINKTHDQYRSQIVDTVREVCRHAEYQDLRK